MTVQSDTTEHVPLATRSWDVTADEVQVGDRYRSLGRGYISRPVEAITRSCNCEQRTRSVDPETHEPLHFPVIVLHGGGLNSHLRPTSTVTLTDGY